MARIPAPLDPASGQGHAPWLSRGKLAVLGTGAALPGPSVSSEALIALMADRFGLTHTDAVAALAQRMAIRGRHLCRPFNARRERPRPDQSNPALAAQAVKVALTDAGLDIDDIGYLIGHTATPMQPLPANVAHVADALGYGGPHLELRQACTGFANALMIAFGLLAAPGARPVIIVGSETGSLFFDPARLADDPGQLVNMVQMGDGAAALVLGPPASDRGSLHSAWYGSIGLNRAPGLQIFSDMAGDNHHDYAAILKSGAALFDADRVAAAAHGLALDDADLIIPHQASGRIGEQVAAHFHLAPERVFVNADRLGNTGSAAIWIALAELRAGGLSSGARVLAFGAEATKYMYGGFVYDHA